MHTDEVECEDCEEIYRLVLEDHEDEWQVPKWWAEILASLGMNKLNT
jgi:hypothetical protein